MCKLFNKNKKLYTNNWKISSGVGVSFLCTREVYKMKKLVLASLLLVCGLVSCAGEVSSSTIEQTSQIQTTDEKIAKLH